MHHAASVSRWLILAVLTSGCGKSAKECRTEAEALGKLLAEADTEPSLLQVPANVVLPSRTDLPRRELSYAPAVNLTATAITYQGQQLAGPEDLRERLAAARANVEDDIARGRFHGERPHPELVYFLIDEATPWLRVVDTVKVAGEAGMRAPAFVFATPITSKPPPRAPIDDKLDAIIASEDASNKAIELARIMSTEVEDCPALMKAFGAVASEESKSKAQVLIEAIPPALIDCGCNVHMANFRSAMWRVLANPNPTRVVAFDPAAVRQTIALPAGTLWREASKRFTAELKFAELVAN